MALPIEQEASRSMSNVAESALALLKAELRVVANQNKQFVVRLGVSAGLLLAGVMLAQLTMVLLAVTPLLIGLRPWWTIASSIALTAVPSVLCLWAGRRSFRAANIEIASQKESTRRASSRPPAASAAERSV